MSGRSLRISLTEAERTILAESINRRRDFFIVPIGIDYGKYSQSRTCRPSRG